MMISPNNYISEYTDSDYHELMDERDRLIKSIKGFEEKEKNGDRSGDEWNWDPSPEVVYQCNLEYLARLCSFMHEKYNTEYVWGDKKL